MKRAVSMVIALVLIILITIVAASAAYYWLLSLQSEMQGGTSRYQAELTEQVTGRLSIVDFQYNVNTQNAKIVMENSGSRKMEKIGSPEDSLIVTTKTSSCDLAFNASNCDVCPFDLDVNEIVEINIGFAGTDCENIEEGIEYVGYFALKEGQVQSSFIPALIYDIWTQMFPDNAPIARKGHAMVIINGTDKIVLFGGYGPYGSNCDDAGSSYCDGTWVYDYSDDNWTQKSPSSKPSGRGYHVMTTIYNDDKVILFGGRAGSSSCDGSESGYCNGTWVYDLSEDNWTLMTTPVELTARTWLAMAAIDGTDKAVLFGGRGDANCDGSGSVYCNGTWVYNYSDDTWTLMSPASKPNARQFHAMATIDGTDKVVLFGGYNDSNNDETWVYDLSDNTWTLMSPVNAPSARNRHAMATIDGTDKVMLFGGWGAGVLDDTWVYDLSDNIWTQMRPADYPSARADHAMVTIYNTEKIMLFGGALDGDETWVYV